MEENSPTTQQQQPTSFLAKLTSYITSVPLVGGGAGGGNNGGNNNNNNTSSKLNKNTPHQNNLEVNSMGGEYYSKSNCLILFYIFFKNFNYFFSKKN